MSPTPARTQPSRAQWLRRLASRKRDRIGFVFSGGGPLGALQVGAVTALFEHGIRPDLAVGTSVGAMNAAWVAFKPSFEAALELQDVWRHSTQQQMFPGGRFRASWARFLTKGDHVFSNAGVRTFVERGLGTPNIEDSLIPLGIVAAELMTGAEKLFTSGPVVEPILASTAMPGVFPPVTIGGQTYVDGGVVDNVPIAPAVEMGATTLFVLDSTSRNQKPRPLNRPIDYLLHAFTLARSQRLEVERPFYADKVRLHVIPFEVVDFYVPFASMAYTEKLIDAGYTATTEYLSHLPATGPTHPPGDQSGADSALI